MLGIVSKLCTKCDGIGQVESRDVQNGKEIWITCKKCKGKGKLKVCLEQFLNKRILVCGGREYDDYRTLSKILHALSPIEIIQGGQKKQIAQGVYVGADYHALQFAIENGIAHQTFMANWKTFRKQAGPIRNKEMLDKSNPDYIVAFPGGNGTQDMINQSLKAGKVVIKVSEVGKIKLLKK